MIITVRATFDGTVFRPDELVDLPGGTNVLLTVDVLDPDNEAPGSSDNRDVYDASALYRAGREHMDAGRLEEAVAVFQRSVEELPHFKTLELLGECLVRLKRDGEAIVPLAAATGLNRGVRAPYLLAEVFLRMGERGDARLAAEEALRRDPNNRRAREVLNTLEPEPQG